MNRLINIIGIVVLCGILLKLSYVFVFLFGELDDDSLISKITGITFAFASIYFVVKVNRRWLKVTMVALDMCTILYFYLHDKFSIPIDFASIIIAIYSGLIIFYLGRIVSERLDSVNDSETKHMRDELNRFRTDNEVRRLENERKLCLRRIADSKTDAKRDVHRIRLDEIDSKINTIQANP